MISRDIKEQLKKLPFIGLVFDIKNHITNPRQQLSVWRDYLQTKRNSTFIRQLFLDRTSNNRQEGSKKLLIISNSNAIYQVKTESMLAIDLVKRGWDVQVLTSRRFTWAIRYFKLFNINSFIYWEDIKLTEQEEAFCVAALKEFSQDSLSIQTIKAWHYKEANIGKQILSSASRIIKEGKLDFDKPFIINTITDLLNISLRTVHRGKHLLDQSKPDLIYLIEAYYAVNGTLVDLAIDRAIDTIQVIQPSQDDALIFKRLNKHSHGIHPYSLSEQSFNESISCEWSEQKETQLQQFFQDRYNGRWFLQNRNVPSMSERSRHELIQSLGLNPDKKIAVIFSHILWDANLFYGKDLFDDYGDWLYQTVLAACDNPNVNWIVKLHPANTWKRAREHINEEYSEITLLKQQIGKLPDHIKIMMPTADISTLSLFSAIDYAITVRGTAGFELPCFAVPTLTAGTGRYSGLGFTVDSNTRDKYLHRLKTIQQLSPLTEEEILKAKIHAWTLFKRRPWQMKSFISSFNYQKRGSHPLDHNLLFNVKSFDDINYHGDLERWTHWILQPGTVDYLADHEQTET